MWSGWNLMYWRISGWTSWFCIWVRYIETGKINVLPWPVSLIKPMLISFSSTYYPVCLTSDTPKVLPSSYFAGGPVHQAVGRAGGGCGQLCLWCSGQDERLCGPHTHRPSVLIASSSALPFFPSHSPLLPTSLVQWLTDFPPLPACLRWAAWLVHSTDGLLGPVRFPTEEWSGLNDVSRDGLGKASV